MRTEPSALVAPEIRPLSRRTGSGMAAFAKGMQAKSPVSKKVQERIVVLIQIS